MLTNQGSYAEMNTTSIISCMLANGLPVHVSVGWMLSYEAFKLKIPDKLAQGCSSVSPLSSTLLPQELALEA